MTKKEATDLKQSIINNIEDIVKSGYYTLDDIMDNIEDKFGVEVIILKESVKVNTELKEKK